MVAPVITAALVGAGGALLGGALSNRANRGIADQNAAYQKEFAQHGIRWKAEDARAAGIHPVFAMSANTPTYTPAVYTDSMGPAVAEAAQHVARGVEKYETAHLQNAIIENQLQKIAGENTVQNILAQREAMINARLFKLDEAGNPIGFKPGFDEWLGLGQSDPGLLGIPGNEFVSQRSVRPMFDRYHTTWGEMLLMTSQEGPTESFDVGLDGRILTIQANMQYYGKDWLNKMLDKGPSWVRNTVKEAPDGVFSFGAITKALEYFGETGKPAPLEFWNDMESPIP